VLPSPRTAVVLAPSKGRTASVSTAATSGRCGNHWHPVATFGYAARKRRQCRWPRRSKALASIAGFHALLKSDEASAATSLFGSAPVSFELFTPGRPMHNKSFDTDAQVLRRFAARLLRAGQLRRYAAGRSVLFSLNSGEVKSQRAWRASFAAVLLRPLASET
jgi:hypothetical protein